jgi:hypothetical protein
MDQEKKIEKQIEHYRELAEGNKDIDVAALALNSLKSDPGNFVSVKMKRWAYLISIALPPVGLFFALRFYLGDEEDRNYVGNVCLILTAVAILLVWLIGHILLSSSGTSLEQIQQIKPQDIQQLVE